MSDREINQNLPARSSNDPSKAVTPFSEFPIANGRSGNVHAQPFEHDSIAIQSIMNILWKRRWPILATIVISVAIGLTYLMHAAPTYEGRAKLYVEREGPRLISEMPGMFMSAEINYMYTQAELIRSSPILEGALAVLDSSNMSTFPADEDPLDFLRENLDVNVGKRDGLLSIGIRSRQPQEAAIIVNTIVESFVEFHSVQSRSASSELLAILHREKKRREAELKEKQKAMIDFRLANETLALEGNQGNIASSRLQVLSEAVTQIQLEEIEASAELLIVTEAVKGTLNVTTLLDSREGNSAPWINELVALQERLDGAKRQLAQVAVDMKPSHPAYRDAATSVEMMQIELDEFNQRILMGKLNTSQQNTEKLRSQLSQLRAELDDQRRVALDLNRQQAQFSVLEAEWLQARRLVELLIERIKEVDVSEDAGGMNITLLETARVESEPIWPIRSYVMLMAVAGGFLLSSTIAVVTALFDTKLNSVEEITRNLPPPVLAQIPEYEENENGALSQPWVVSDPLSPIAEAFRTLRTSLYFCLQSSGNQCSSVLVTSSVPGEGKSIVCSNLAASLAQSGKRTLIIDTDFRAQRQAQLHSIPMHRAGLSEVLTGRIKLMDAIVVTKMENLCVLTAGRLLPQTGELIDFHTCSELLKTLSSHFDRILLDSPPVLAVADSRTLAACADATVLVVRPGCVGANTLENGISALTMVRANLLGAVINAIPRSQVPYGYGYGYGSKKAVEALT